MLQFLFTLVDPSDYNKIERLYNKYYDGMLRYAISKFVYFGRSNYTYDAEDAVQNTFTKITKAIDAVDFSVEEKTIKNFCFSVLTNEIYNILKEKEDSLEFREEVFIENTYSYVEELIIQENYDKIVKIIESLDEKYSSTLNLVFCQEMSVDQIADLMGISAKTVYTRLARGKKLLIEALKGVNNDE